MDLQVEAANLAVNRAVAQSTKMNEIAAETMTKALEPIKGRIDSTVKAFVTPRASLTPGPSAVPGARHSRGMAPPAACPSSRARSYLDFRSKQPVQRMPWSVGHFMNRGRS